MMYRGRLFIDLLFAFIVKNFKVRYKQSLLGPLWIILQPVILTLIFVIIQVVTGIQSEGIPYPIFVYVGLMPWTFFSNALIFSSISIIENAQIIKKIACPREVFPLASVLTSLLDLLVAFIILVPLLIYYGLGFNVNLILISLVILLHLAMTIGLALIFSSISVFRRDIIIGLPLLLQFWLLASPVMYPLSAVPIKWQSLCLLNPMAGFIKSYRDIIIIKVIPEKSVWLSMIFGAIVSLSIGLKIFVSLKKRFADVV